VCGHRHHLPTYEQSLSARFALHRIELSPTRRDFEDAFGRGGEEAGKATFKHLLVVSRSRHRKYFIVTISIHSEASGE
jgi:hypothetical protein